MQPINRREALKRVGLMLGAAVTAPAAAGFLSGCRPSTGADWTPRTLSPEEDELVIALTERIIPATDTPGAEAAGVNRYIDMMLTDWHPEEDRERFLRGLQMVQAQSQEMLGQPFAEASTEEQIRLLEALDQEAYPNPSARDVEDDKVQEATRAGSARGREEPDEALDADSTGLPPAGPPENADAEDPPFFRMIKEMTVLGYYTSEIGMTEELRWMPWPGYYDGCVPFEEIGRAWA